MKASPEQLRIRLERYGALAAAEQTAAAHGIHLDLVLGETRHACVVAARHDVMRALRAGGLSFPVIGHLLGRDHTTVLAACRKPAKAVPRFTPPLTTKESA